MYSECKMLNSLPSPFPTKISVLCLFDLQLPKTDRLMYAEKKSYYTELRQRPNRRTRALDTWRKSDP